MADKETIINTNEENIKKLKKLAKWLEAHPHVPPIYLDRLDVFAYTKEQFIEIAKNMGQMLNKKVNEPLLHARYEAGGHRLPD